MYICGLVIPVPADRKEAYRGWADTSAAIFKEYGCLEILGCFTPLQVMGRSYPVKPLI